MSHYAGDWNAKDPHQERRAAKPHRPRNSDDPSECKAPRRAKKYFHRPNAHFFADFQGLRLTRELVNLFISKSFLPFVCVFATTCRTSTSRRRNSFN